MNIEIVCDKCFENIELPGTFYRRGYTFGSCTYCEKCYIEIQEEFKKEELTLI